MKSYIFKFIAIITFIAVMVSCGDSEKEEENSNNYLTIENGVVVKCDAKAEGTVTIPDGVKGIGDDAFYECSKLESIEIPDSVTYIGDNAFRRCSSLENVAIGNGVESIGDAAFFQLQEPYKYYNSRQRGKHRGECVPRVRRT